MSSKNSKSHVMLGKPSRIDKRSSRKAQPLLTLPQVHLQMAALVNDCRHILERPIRRELANVLAVALVFGPLLLAMQFSPNTHPVSARADASNKLTGVSKPAGPGHIFSVPVKPHKA